MNHANWLIALVLLGWLVSCQQNKGPYTTGKWIKFTHIEEVALRQ